MHMLGWVDLHMNQLQFELYLNVNFEYCLLNKPNLDGGCQIKGLTIC